MTSPPTLHPLTLLHRYASGYFPMIDDEDPAHPVFFWDRWPVRAVLPVNAQTAARARRMGRRAQGAGGRFEIRYTTAVETVLGHLQRVKEHSWVRGQVVDIYRALHEAGVLRTVEAWERDTDAGTRRRGDAAKEPRLVGALLGLVLPGVFVAETMYGLVPEASKVCLCQLVEDCWNAGHPTYELIDVQPPHNLDEYGLPLPRKTGTAHPCIRLGEQHLPLAAYLAAFAAAWKRAFAGGISEWLELASREKARGAVSVRFPE